MPKLHQGRVSCVKNFRAFGAEGGGAKKLKLFASIRILRASLIRIAALRTFEKILINLDSSVAATIERMDQVLIKCLEFINRKKIEVILVNKIFRKWIQIAKGQTPFCILFTLVSLDQDKNALELLTEFMVLAPKKALDYAITEHIYLTAVNKFEVINLNDIYLLRSITSALAAISSTKSESNSHQDHSINLPFNIGFHVINNVLSDASTEIQKKNCEIIFLHLINNWAGLRILANGVLQKLFQTVAEPDFKLRLKALNLIFKIFGFIEDFPDFDNLSLIDKKDQLSGENKSRYGTKIRVDWKDSWSLNNNFIIGEGLSLFNQTQNFSLTSQISCERMRKTFGGKLCCETGLATGLLEALRIPEENISEQATMTLSDILEADLTINWEDQMIFVEAIAFLIKKLSRNGYPVTSDAWFRNIRLNEINSRLVLSNNLLAEKNRSETSILLERFIVLNTGVERDSKNYPIISGVVGPFYQSRERRDTDDTCFLENDKNSSIVRHRKASIKPKFDTIKSNSSLDNMVNPAVLDIEPKYRMQKFKIEAKKFFKNKSSSNLLKFNQDNNLPDDEGIYSPGSNFSPIRSCEVSPGEISPRVSGVHDRNQIPRTVKLGEKITSIRCDEDAQQDTGLILRIKSEPKETTQNRKIVRPTPLYPTSWLNLTKEDIRRQSAPNIFRLKMKTNESDINKPGPNIEKLEAATLQQILLASEGIFYQHINYDHCSKWNWQLLNLELNKHDVFYNLKKYDKGIDILISFFTPPNGDFVSLPYDQSTKQNQGRFSKFANDELEEQVNHPEENTTNHNELHFPTKDCIKVLNSLIFTLIRIKIQNSPKIHQTTAIHTSNQDSRKNSISVNSTNSVSTSFSSNIMNNSNQNLTDSNASVIGSHGSLHFGSSYSQFFQMTKDTASIRVVVLY